MLRARFLTYGVQVASQAAVSAATLLIPLYAKALGASDLEVGLIVAGHGAAVFFSAYLAGNAADRKGKRLMIRAGLAASAGACALQALATDPVSLGLARASFGLAAGMFPAALVAYAYDQTRKPGRFAAWGALGFGLGTLMAGAIGGIQAIFLASSALLVACFALALRLPARPEVHVRVPLFPRGVIRKNLPAYLAMLIRHTGASAVWAVFPIYLAGLGADALAIGVIYSLNAVSQFLLMNVSDRYPSAPMAAAGLALSAVTFLAFALARELWMIYPVQLILGASWAFLYVGSLKFVMERNVERATSTGLLQSSISLGHIAGPVLGGVVAQAWGYGSTLWLAFLLSLIAIPLFLPHLRERAAAGI